MEHNLFGKIADFVKKEKRLCLAGVFLIVIFLLNQMIFSSQKITPEDCLEGKCGTFETEKPQLSKEESSFYLDDILKDIPSGYYRLTFQSKTDQEEKILVKLNTYTEKNETIGEILLKPSEKVKNHEVFFFLPEGFDNILFEKENPSGTGNIFIQNIGISKLNVDNQKDFASMRETMIGEINTDLISASQLQQKYPASFDMLQEPKTTLGQIFKAQDEYISGISFNMDIIKKPYANNEKYNLYLWEVRCDEGDCRAQGEAIAKKSFSIKSALEKYRQSDGTFRFPLYANVEKGKSYFAGIDNSLAEVDSKNYLDMKGNRDENSYIDGMAGFKKEGVVYKTGGDLFFLVHGVNLDIRDGTRILNGAKIESLGKGQGKYSYATKGEFLDILDLWSASGDTNFKEGEKIIVGKAQEDSFLMYEINTIFPMRRIHFFAEQTKTDWIKVQIEYSFDRKNWTKAPFSEKTKRELLVDEISNQEDSVEGEVLPEKNADTTPDEKIKEMLAQVFDFDVTAPNGEKTIYFKITPDLTDLSNKARYFSIKNLKITANLNVE